MELRASEQRTSSDVRCVRSRSRCRRSHRGSSASRCAPRRFLGGIRRANQGMFEILPRDRAQGITEEGQLQKTVRVVSTVDYNLE